VRDHPNIFSGDVSPAPGVERWALVAKVAPEELVPDPLLTPPPVVGGHHILAPFAISGVETTVAVSPQNIESYVFYNLGHGYNNPQVSAGEFSFPYAISQFFRHGLLGVSALFVPNPLAFTADLTYDVV
jgi:hypothetical protein